MHHCWSLLFSTNITFELQHNFVQTNKILHVCVSTENQIIFVPPNRYIFRGAEVYSDDSDTSNSDSDDSSAPFGLMFDNEDADPDDTTDMVNSLSPSSSPIHAMENLNSSADLSDAVNDKACPLTQKELKQQDSGALH